MDPTKRGKTYHQYQDRAPRCRGIERGFSKVQTNFIGKKITANTTNQNGKEQEIFNRVFKNQDL